MELVLGHQTLDAAGGSETYLLTVAEQLQRLGHEVTINVEDRGTMASVAASRGLRVVADEHELPAACDGIVVQDGAMSLALADRYPGTTQVFVAHAPGLDLQRPVQLEGLISAVVALNDRVAQRLDGLAQRHEIVRLRQPIDVHRFTPRGGPRRTPERALLLSNHVWNAKRAMLEESFAEAGITFEHVGRPTRSSASPERDIADCDITLGVGRAALEAMSSGRAVYVLDRFTGDGWVTAQAYPRMEADGFAGMSSGEPLDGARLRRDIASYSPDMGIVNRQLVMRHHHALEHARELIGLLRRLQPSRPAPRAPLQEMARLVRLQWQTQGLAATLTAENAVLRERVESERDRAQADLEAVHAELSALRATRRWRLACRLARPFDGLRSRLR